MLHQPHARVARPALLVVVAHDVLVVRVRVLRQEPLNQVLRLLRREPEHYVHLVHVARVQTDRVVRLRLRVVERQVLVRQRGRARQLRRAVHAQQQQVENESVVLEDEAGELEAGDQPVVVHVLHVLEGDLHVALLRHVVRQVVVHDQPQQARQQRRVDLLEHLVERRLHQHVALAVLARPEVRQVVHALAELVHQVRLRLLVARLHPVREQLALVRLVPQVLVQVRVRDLLQRVDLVHGHQVRVQVQELQAHVLEHVLRQQVPLDLLQRVVRVVEPVLDQRQLVALQLVHAARAVVVLPQSLQRQRQQLRVVLVLRGREGDGREVSRLQPVHRRLVDRHALLHRHVRTVLQEVLLPLLLLLQEQPRQPTHVLLAHRLVHRRAAADALAHVVRHVRPPVRLRLHVALDQRLDGGRQSRHLPRDVRLPAAPRLGQVLEDHARLVRSDAFRHHVRDVLQHRRAQLQVVVALHALLCYRVRRRVAVAALELARQQVLQPALQQRHDAAQEEQPHAPAREPEPAARTLAHGARVESVVDEVLEVLAHAHLAHQAVLVPVHARQLPDVREAVLQAVRQLVRVDVAQSELDVAVHDDLRQAQDLARQVERVAEAALLALLRRQRLHRLQVEVVVPVQVVQSAAVDHQVKRVEALPHHLDARLHPVLLRRLEELGAAQRANQVATLLRLRVMRIPLTHLWRLAVQLVHHPALQQLLVRHLHLRRQLVRHVLAVPRVHQRHVEAPTRAARPQVERARRVVQRDAVRCCFYVLSS